MQPKFLLLFNHTLTLEQKADAQKNLGISSIVEPPETVRRLWSSLPPEPDSLFDSLAPIRYWLNKYAEPGNYILIQGDFGACWLMISHAQKLGLRPVYSTTCREAVEEKLDDGSTRLIHRIRHVRFREYGK